MIPGAGGAGGAGSDDCCLWWADYAIYREVYRGFGDFLKCSHSRHTNMAFPTLALSGILTNELGNTKITRPLIVLTIPLHTEGFN